MVRVSVILPVHNAGDAIKHTLRQLGELSCDDTEFIFVDDASSDGTGAVLADFCARGDSRFLLTAEENLGPAGARNLGLTVAHGDYVWFVDWDDEWAPNILDVLVEATEGGIADVVACRARWRLGSGVDLKVTDGVNDDAAVGPSDAVDLLLRGVLRGYLWNKLFRRALLGREPFPNMRTQEDLCVVASALSSARHVVLISNVLYYHVIRDGSVTNSVDPPLANLDYSRDAVLRAARSLPDTARRRTLMERFSLDVDLSIVGTALRLASDSTQREVMHRTRSSLQAARIFKVASVDPKLATKALVLKYLGDGYPSLRRVVLKPRAWLRRLRSARVDR
ncbi:glycosyltransferase family 2 protein [Microbacterium sp. A196]|uniref:glycosyltransferase family 2 protein n=1 Tax=Microbacterium sp. A196 TaxID=3457320 RepID=UPI003FD5DBDE